MNAIAELPQRQPAQDEAAKQQALADEYQRDAIASAQSLMPDDDAGEL